MKVWRRDLPLNDGHAVAKETSPGTKAGGTSSGLKKSGLGAEAERNPSWASQPVGHSPVQQTSPKNRGGDL